MIHIKDLKKHKNLYNKLSLIGNNAQSIKVMFDYFSSGIWGTKGKRFIVSNKIKRKLKKWIYASTCFYYSYSTKEIQQDENLKKEEIALDLIGLEIAKEIKKEKKIKVCFQNKDNQIIELP